jgi:hypothetical protein
LRNREKATWRIYLCTYVLGFRRYMSTTRRILCR